MGKNLQATQELNRIFRERLVNKIYLALVLGRVSEGGSIEGYQTKSGDNLVTLSDSRTDNSAYVLTHYKPVVAADGYTLLEVKLETGKSHQIRVALSSINHPIAGDSKYGRAEVNKLLYKRYRLGGQVLHSTKLIFHSDGILSYLNDRVFKAATPPIFNKIYKDVLGYEDN
jgi:23S rRNA pseudouridine955/2504/2580 synthase